MAWAFVSGAATQTATVTKNVTAGDLIVVFHTFGDATSAPTISDTDTNAWTQGAAQPVRDGTNGQSSVSWWAIAKTTLSITITIAASAGIFMGTAIAEYSGNAAAAVGDGSNSALIAASTAANGQATGSVTTTQNGDLIVSFITDSGAVATVAQFTAGTGFTKRPTASFDPGSGAGITYAVEDSVQAALGAINPTWTATALDAALGITMAFKAAAAGGTSRQQTLTMLGAGV
jgi:hypothetical protein